MSRLLFALLAMCLACATAPPRHASHINVVVEVPELCEHKVPKDTCTRCHPELVDRFKSLGDWCEGHGVPETQCLICHPDMKFAVLPKLPETADIKFISGMGEDVAELAQHVAPGKVTLFDFYADWCVACREVDVHLYSLLAAGKNIAVRKLNVVSWEHPVAQHYLSQTPSLPLLIVYDSKGREFRRLSGVDPQALEDALNDGAR